MLWINERDKVLDELQSFHRDSMSHRGLYKSEWEVRKTENPLFKRSVSTTYC